MAIHEALGEKEADAPGEKVILETQARGLGASQGQKAGLAGLAELTQAQDQRWKESFGDTKHGSWLLSGGPKTQEQMAGTAYEHEEAMDGKVSGFNRAQEGLEQALSGGQPESRNEPFQPLHQTKVESSAVKAFDATSLGQASASTQYPEGAKESFMEPSRSRLSENVQGAGQSDTIEAQIHKANIRDQQVVHMELEPPELGLLRVRIKVHRDGVEALFLTQGPEQKAALEQGLSQLRQSLAEQGFINQHLAVDVGDGRGNWTFQNRMQGSPLWGQNPDPVAEPRQEHTSSSPAQEEPGILHLRV
ncbi:MAG: flagellar hook-length control protein FliK [bacterium]